MRGYSTVAAEDAGVAIETTQISNLTVHLKQSTNIYTVHIMTLTLCDFMGNVGYSSPPPEKPER